jgi:hypothetical protein
MSTAVSEGKPWYVPLSPDNLAYAVGLAKELHALGTYGQNGPEFDWDYTCCTMLGVMRDPNYYFKLAWVDGVCVGAVCGKVVTFYFSPKIMGVEDAWYVREGTKKRAAIGMRLMRGFVDWCIDTKGAVLVQSGDVAGIRTVAVDALYRHMGFTRFGTIYKYERAT